MAFPKYLEFLGSKVRRKLLTSLMIRMKFPLLSLSYQFKVIIYVGELQIENLIIIGNFVSDKPKS